MTRNGRTEVADNDCGLAVFSRKFRRMLDFEEERGGREYEKVGRKAQAAVVRIPVRMCFTPAYAYTPAQKTEDTKMKHDLPWTKCRTAQGTSILRARARSAPSSGT